MRIALVSLNQIWEDKYTNLLECEKYIEKASQENIDLIIFPEMTLTGFSTNIIFTAEDENTSKSLVTFSNLAKKYSIAIIFGVVIKDNDKALNKSIFINQQGELIGKYSKIHPFSFAGEDTYFNGGNKLVIVNFEDMNIGLTICYDLRFPELYSSLGSRCDLIINIANWPSKRIDHWNTLLKARAIENQLLIAGVNRIGIDGNGLEYIESSNIFNANGEKLDFEQINDIKIYKINKNLTKDFKEKFNTTNDRKIDFYKGIR
jgi:omega-amidase